MPPERPLADRRRARLPTAALLFASACADPTAAGDDAEVDAGPAAEAPDAAGTYVPGPADPAPGSLEISVATVDALLAALAVATPGTVIRIPGDAVLDLTGHSKIAVPAGVAIASDRGAVDPAAPDAPPSAGALLFTTQLETLPLFVAGDAVRFTGLRLQGPDPERRASAYVLPVSRGIDASHADNVQVDHAELSGWAHAAVMYDYARRGHVHHNSIHHNQRSGLGYGVLLNRAAEVLIERNDMNANRHSIAGTGKPGLRYEARFNLIGSTRNGHAFDMHGENETSGNGSPYAGEFMNVYGNSFRGGQIGVLIRGRPRIGAYVRNNCFASSASAAVQQHYFTGNLTVSGNTYGDADGACHQRVAGERAIRGDVDGDGLADVVTLAHASVFVYLGAKHGGLTAVPPSRVGALDSGLVDGAGEVALELADVDGDLRADLVTAGDDGSVRVYPGRLGGGFGEPVRSLDGGFALAGPAAPDGEEPLGVADVDGDGLADLVTLRAGSVVVRRGQRDLRFGAEAASFAGTYDSATVDGVGHLAIDVADVTGDRRADLVTGHRDGDAYVFPGRADGTFGPAVASFAGTLAPALLDGVGFEPIGVGDVTGDGRGDLVAVHTDGTLYVYPGAADGRFTARVASFAGGLASATFGGGGYELIAPLDVTGDGHADLVASRDGDVVVWPGASSGGFGAPVASFDGAYASRRDVAAGGHEAVGAKPLARRRGCGPAGCVP